MSLVCSQFFRYLWFMPLLGVRSPWFKQSFKTILRVITSVPQKTLPSAVYSNTLLRSVRFSAEQTLVSFKSGFVYWRLNYLCILHYFHKSGIHSHWHDLSFKAGLALRRFLPLIFYYFCWIYHRPLKIELF